MFFTEKRRTKKLQKTVRKKKLKSSVLKGGEAVGSGGFSCVMKPALPGMDDILKGNVKNSFLRRRDRMISKIFTKESQAEEYRLIKTLRTKLRKVSGYKKHFLLDRVTMDTPAFEFIKEEDWKGFDEKCTKNPKMFKVPRTEDEKRDATETLRLLNMPDGGMEVGKYFTLNFSFPRFHVIRRDLSSLVRKAIIPMNKKGVFHSDIRSANLLFSDGHVRLIDWGLAREGQGYNKTRYRSLSKNLPASCLMLTEKFEKAYNDELLPELIRNKKSGKMGKGDNEILRKRFLLKYFVKTKDFEKRMDVIIGLSKLYALLRFHGPRVKLPASEILRIGGKQFQSHESAINILLDQQSSVLRNKRNYDLKKRELDVNKYYNQVYRKNVDLFGVASVFAEFSRIVYNEKQQRKEHVDEKDDDNANNNDGHDNNNVKKDDTDNDNDNHDDDDDDDDDNDDDIIDKKQFQTSWKVGRQLYLYAIKNCDRAMSKHTFLKILDNDDNNKGGEKDDDNDDDNDDDDDHDDHDDDDHDDNTIKKDDSHSLIKTRRLSSSKYHTT